MKCLRAEKTERCTKFQLRTTPRFSCVCDDFWAYPAAEKFAEWLRRNLCIPDQEYVDSLISLYLCYNSVYILGDLLDGLLLIPSQGYGKVAPIQLESKSSVHTPAIR